MSKFNPPSEFNFTSPGEWPEWKQRFARYRLATKLNKENGEVQVCSLIYAMGSEAEKIFASFEFATEDDKKNYEGVLSKLDEYFIPRRNVIHERACFYQRNQLQGEKAEAYIRVLYELAENCDFSDKRDEHIRDRLVVGIKDKELSLKLQLTADLTLAHVIQQEDVAKYYTKSTPHTLKESPQTALEAVYAPGKTLAVADALSRGPLEQTGDEHLEEDVTVHIGAVLSHLPATPRKLQQIRDHTIQDPELQLVKQLTQTGWSTPTTSTGFSPAELLMGRKIRTTLPTLSANLDPSWPDRKEMRSADAAAKLKQAFYYNRRNGVRHLPPLDPGEGVLMKLDNEKQWTTQGTTQGNCSTPRSYVVVTPEGGCYRRNRRHLLRLPAASKNPNPSGSPDDPLPVSSDVGSKSVFPTLCGL
uniref:Retrotransposon gag domain-containing protein n=1 Tax=Knipowitschia caucasica TaxID=637954 RepID=A0AAV2LWA8_KNICA